ncbi:hypothetical protein FQA39_LY06384 [Lamprigera yunnana]|nr:hypothetical protein FQA39_LY06384 [Lamprigera yunnana]
MHLNECSTVTYPERNSCLTQIIEATDLAIYSVPILDILQLNYKGSCRVNNGSGPSQENDPDRRHGDQWSLSPTPGCTRHSRTATKGTVCGAKRSAATHAPCAYVSAAVAAPMGIITTGISPSSEAKLHHFEWGYLRVPIIWLPLGTIALHTSRYVLNQSFMVFGDFPERAAALAIGFE